MPRRDDPIDDDATLVARCRQGDGSAWAVLVHRYQRLVYTIVLRAGLDEHQAADVFQTVFARLLDHLRRIADPSRLQAWIVTCAKREALLLRHRGRRHLSLDDEDSPAAVNEPADESPLPEEMLSALQEAHALRQAFEQLDERCRQLLRLSFGDEPAGYDEIARRMAMPVGSIGPTRGRCLRKLRELMR